jgi:hypothetical protein
MGGLLAAEVVLLPPFSPATGQAFRHRILGTINFDVPFLGMHPGVIASGLGSIFRGADPPPQDSQSASETPLTSPSSTTVGTENDGSSVSNRPPRHDTLYSQPTDPNFNPRFENDVNVPIRKGWRNFVHFVNKHSDGLRKATTQYVKSHLEFGGAMADYPGLKARYAKIRALELESEHDRRHVFNSARAPPRVRFANYYTASTGRPKKPKSPSRSRSRGSEKGNESLPVENETQSLNPSAAVSVRSRSGTPSLRISIEEHRGDEIIVKQVIDPVVSPISPEAAQPEACSEQDDDSPGSPDTDTLTLDSSSITSPMDTSILPADFQLQLPNLPPVPDEPTQPSPLDLSKYSDKSAQKIAQKDHDRVMKAYRQAVKDRNAAIKDRQKLEEKLRKKAAKAMLKKQKEEEQAKAKQEKPVAEGAPSNEDLKNAIASEATTADASTSAPGYHETDSEHRGRRRIAQSETDAALAPVHSNTSTTALSPHRQPTDPNEPPKPKKDRKFCLLPSKNPDGSRDPTWIRVYMKDVDEVGAHCGLFIPGSAGESYERLVGDVTGQIEEWVRENMSERAMVEW